MPETDNVGVAATNNFADPRFQFFLIHFGKNLANEATPMELKKIQRDCADLQPIARNRVDRFGAAQTPLTCQ